jgi:hypothetical protein
MKKRLGSLLEIGQPVRSTDFMFERGNTLVVHHGVDLMSMFAIVAAGHVANFRLVRDLAYHCMCDCATCTINNDKGDHDMTMHKFTYTNSQCDLAMACVTEGNMMHILTVAGALGSEDE